MIKINKEFFIKAFNSAMAKLVGISDHPQRIAMGLGLGAFLGVLPGVGPLTALALAAFFKVNKASALLGVLITNTWITFATFVLSIKLGSVIMKLDWHQLHQEWMYFIKHFHWSDLLKAAVLKMVLPVVIGYLIIGLLFGLVVYVVSLIIITRFKKTHI